MGDQGSRNLTDADVDAILDRAEERFYKLVGKGVMGMFWKVVLPILLTIATGTYLWMKK